VRCHGYADLSALQTDSILRNSRPSRGHDSHYECITIPTALQLPVDTWHAYLGEPTLADAILDRIVHHSHRIELKTKGESLRETLPLNGPRSDTKRGAEARADD